MSRAYSRDCFRGCCRTCSLALESCNRRLVSRTSLPGSFPARRTIRTRSRVPGRRPKDRRTNGPRSARLRIGVDRLARPPGGLLPSGRPPRRPQATYSKERGFQVVPPDPNASGAESGRDRSDPFASPSHPARCARLVRPSRAHPRTSAGLSATSGGLFARTAFFAHVRPHGPHPRVGEVTDLRARRFAAPAARDPRSTPDLAPFPRGSRETARGRRVRRP
jgi:hypothetical protein